MFANQPLRPERTYQCMLTLDGPAEASSLRGAVIPGSNRERSDASLAGDAFRHEAFLYSGEDEFLAGTAAFVRDGLDEDAAVLVMASARKVKALRAELGSQAGAVWFGDMEDVGRNPACIIPAWRRFVDEHGPDGRPLRGVGEPVWPGRSAAEVSECHRHETLVNVAFAEPDPWWLLCPYDVGSLDHGVIEDARRNHPFVLEGGRHRRSSEYAGPEPSVTLDGPLPDPPPGASEMVFEAGPLRVVRRFVERHATSAGLGPVRTSDLVFAINEVATNSLRHGGGRGVLRIWQDDAALVCELRDQGRIRHPLVGRQVPGIKQENGRGIWLVNHLCDLVELRSSAAGTIVRLHMRRAS